jgi:uncharacterized membrane protein SirB2
MMPSKPFSQPERLMNSGALSDRPNVRLVFLVSMLIMALWPMIAFGLCAVSSIFEQSSDFILLFGGVTLLFLLPLGLLDPPDWIFSATIGLVWMIVLVLPVVLAASQRVSRKKLVIAFVLQAVFSAMQAGLGLLMLAGRQV